MLILRPFRARPAMCALALAFVVALAALPAAGSAATDGRATGTDQPAPVAIGALQDTFSGQTPITIQFTPGASDAVQDATVDSTLGVQTAAIPQINVIVVSVPSIAAASILSSLNASSSVVSAQVDGYAQATDTAVNDPGSLIGGAPIWPLSLPQFPRAWDATTGSSSVIVADVDTGVDQTRSDFAGTGFVTGYNAFGGTANTADDFGHGTETASIIAARTNNGLGVAGVCWTCKIMPVKALDSTGHGAYSVIAAGITWATDHGAKVINLSLGGTSADATLQAAIGYASSHGVFVAISAGNDGLNESYYPASYARSYTGVVSVVATDSTDARYTWSNYGSQFDVTAPGCTSADVRSTDTYVTGFCGTSAAAPFVSGLAALMLSYNSSLTAAQIETAIETTTDKVPVSSIAQNGRINARKTLVAAGASLPVAAPSVAAVSFSGSVQEAANLTATTAAGDWSGSAPVSVSLQWQRCASTPASCANISGATAASYTLASADVGSRVRLVETGSNITGSVVVPSTMSDVVAAATAPGASTLTTALPGPNNDLTFTGTPGTTVTFQPGDVAAPTVAVDGQSIVVTYRDQTVGALSGSIGNLSSPGPSFSPDGSKLCYSVVYNVPLETSHLWERDIFGGTPVQLTSGASEDVEGCSWSPDGQTIAYVDQSLGKIRTIPASGGSPTTVNITGPNLTWISTRVVYSPDGKTFAFCGVYTGGVSNHNIWTAPVTGGAATQVSFETDGGADLPSWSPDGQRITYANDNRDDNHQIVKTVSALGGDVVTIGTYGDRSSYSPDGSTIIYLDGNNAIMQAPVAGGTPTSFFGLIGGAATPIYSPDGKMVAFSNWQGGSFQLRLIGADGGTQVTSTAANVVAAIRASAPARALVSVTNAAGNDGSGAAAPMSATSLSGPPSYSGAQPTSSGSASVGGTISISVSPSDFTGSPAPTLSYQWYRTSIGAPISGATAASYAPTVSDYGHQLFVVVTATNASGTATVTSTSTSAVSAVAPSVAAVTFSGSAEEGSSLSATTTASDWSSTTPVSVTWQWQRCDSAGANCADITGATTANYTLTGADVGGRVRLVETGSNISGSVAVTSSVSALVSAAPAPPTPAPTTTIDSGPDHATTNTAAAFTFHADQDGATFACSLDGTPSACTSPTSYAGLALGQHTLTVTATDGNGTGSATSYTWTISAVAPPPTSAPVATIDSGPLLATTAATAAFGFHADQVGATFACSLDGSSSACTSPQSYFGLALGQHTFTVTATDSNGTGAAASYTWTISAIPPVPVAPSNDTRPSITGTAQVGSLLTADMGTWSGDATIGYTYLWQRCDVTGANCAAIAGATGNTYTAIDADADHTLVLIVTATNDAGSANALSAAVAIAAAGVTPAPPAPPVTPPVTPPVNPPANNPPASGGGSPPLSSGGSGGGGGSTPNMSLELTADSAPVVGQELVYRLRVYGELHWGTTYDTVADAVLPANVTITRTYLDHGAGCTISGQHVHCDMSWMNPGQSVTALIFTTVTSGGTFSATASCFAAGEQDLSDNATSLTLTVGGTPAPPASTPSTSTPPATRAPGQNVITSPALPSTIRLAGKPVVGATLSVRPATKITGVHYHWQVRGPKGYTNLSGQAAASLRLTGSLAGKQVRAVVSNGKQSCASAPTKPIRRH